MGDLDDHGFELGKIHGFPRMGFDESGPPGVGRCFSEEEWDQREIGVFGQNQRRTERPVDAVTAIPRFLHECLRLEEGVSLIFEEDSVHADQSVGFAEEVWTRMIAEFIFWYRPWWWRWRRNFQCWKRAREVRKWVKRENMNVAVQDDGVYREVGHSQPSKSKPKSHVCMILRFLFYHSNSLSEMNSIPLSTQIRTHGRTVESHAPKAERLFLTTVSWWWSDIFSKLFHKEIMTIIIFFSQI